jgi:2-keto-4-pentenoate hydratase/2-oxohepta-3-ene-1,7-dioic acid hydratase in catechol pathway
MRLVSYGQKGAERAGILLERGVVDLAQALERSGAGVPVSDLRLFLEQPDWRSALERAVGAAKQLQPLGGVRLGAPVPLPRKLMIAGANTYSHLKEAEPLLGKVEPPRQPMILGKATSAICGPQDDILLTAETKKLDYEVELGVVLGRTAYRIKPAEVKHYVAGFTTTNDVSARDVQLAQHETNSFYRVHYLGKSFDTFAPMGPLVTLDDLEWGKSLKLRTEVNGEVRQTGDTSDLIFGVEELVSYISRFLTLYPGDIIQTGSPAGVAFFMQPQRFLRHGDRVRCEVEGLGAIENVVREQ